MVHEDPMQEVLLAADAEVHNHLRDTDQKRDRLLELYLKLIFTLFSAFAGLEFLNVSWNTTTLTIASLVLGIALLFGETVYFAMVGARKWHAEYVNAHILIHTAITTRTFDFSSVSVPQEKRHPFLPSPFTNRSFILVQLCNASLILLLSSLWFKKVQHYGILVACAIAIGIFVTLNTVRGNHILRKAESDFWNNPENCWIIAGLSAIKNLERSE